MYFKMFVCEKTLAVRPTLQGITTDTVAAALPSSLPLPRALPAPKQEKNGKRKNVPSVAIQRHLASAVRLFLDAQRHAPVARRAVVTASLSLFRHSCAVGVPSKLSGAAVHAVICAVHTATIPASAGVCV